MYYYSPLRYPGGKSKISNYFKKVIETNGFSNITFIEPYAGGASIALTLLIEKYVSKIILNDIDRSIYSFWYSVLNRTEELCKLINNTDINIDVWRKQKAIQLKKKDVNLLKLGFSTFFLNRANRSGIINAGVIGGLKQSGHWKIDSRFNKKKLIKKIEFIACFKEKIKINNFDSIELVNKVKENKEINHFFYFDPPYFTQGKNLYLNFYETQDHINIYEQVKQINTKYWILTYDNVPFIRNLYSNFPKFKYALRYSVAKSYKGEELMIFSKNLSIPKFQL